MKELEHIMESNPLALKAKALTTQHFGRTIHLYAPIYLSNECTNNCLYCGFKQSKEQSRKTLTISEMTKEFEILKQQGFEHILLLTGESPLQAGIDYLVEAIKCAKQYFAQISLEIFPASTKDYRKLVEAGASGLTIYQETYNKQIYAQVHLNGKKADYEWRLTAPERALSAGFRKIGLGVLLGLAPWKEDIAELAEHAKTLLKTYWQSELTISFPRLHHTPQGYSALHPVCDQELMQIIFSLRCLLPEIGLILSTRESQALRDQLIGFGITHMSAGSKTNPGGYQNLESTNQFQIDDSRDLKQTIEAIKQKGFEPILKDWDKIMV